MGVCSISTVWGLDSKPFYDIKNGRFPMSQKEIMVFSNHTLVYPILTAQTTLWLLNIAMEHIPFIYDEDHDSRSKKACKVSWQC